MVGAAEGAFVGGFVGALEEGRRVGALEEGRRVGALEEGRRVGALEEGRRVGDTVGLTVDFVGQAEGIIEGFIVGL